MKRFLCFLWRRRMWIGGVFLLFIAGAFVGWEDRRVNDGRTGKAIVQHRGLIFAWKPCGANGGGAPITFHVRQKLLYGLVSLEANGSTY